MYEKFYGLQAKPFRLSPDPHFFFTSATHKSALAHLRYGLYQGEGFVVLTGAAGTGKTTLMRTLLGELPRREMVVGELMTTQLQADDLLRTIAAAFHLDTQGAKSELLGRLQEFLVARGRARRRALLVVDEAHNLPQSSFEELRMLSNFQQGARALLQCILLGQPPLRDALARANMEQLQQRVIAAHHLHPLGADETRAYVLHRLRLTGWRGDPSFSADALAQIYRYSLGVPRRINLLCDRLLLFGSLEALHHLDAAATAQVYGEWAAETGQGLGHEPLLSMQDGVTLAGLDRSDAAASVDTAPAAPARATHAVLPSAAPAHERSARGAAPPRRITTPAQWRPALAVAASLAFVALLFTLWPAPRVDESRAGADDVIAPPPEPAGRAHDTPPVAPKVMSARDVSAPAASPPAPVEASSVARRLAPHEMTTGAQELVDVDATLALASTDSPEPRPRAAVARAIPREIIESGKKPRSRTAAASQHKQIETPARSSAAAQKVAAAAGTTVSPAAQTVAASGNRPVNVATAEAPVDTSAVKPPPLSEEELAAMLTRFQGAYEGGDVSKLAGLFARDAQSDEAHDRDAIVRTYQKLFNVTDARHLALKDVRWQEAGEEAMQGEGQFGVTVREKGRDIESHYTGRIRLRVEKRDGKAVITQLEHRYTQ